MKTKITLALLILVNLITAQPYTYNWTKVFGGNSFPYAITSDFNGNIYTTGSLQNGVGDFDPGSGVHNLTSISGPNSFVSKLDIWGNYVWVKKLEGASVGRNVKIDVYGNVYVIGNFGGTIDFDPGLGVYNLSCPGALPSMGYIWKLSPSGNFLWAKQMKDIDSVNFNLPSMPVFCSDIWQNLLAAGSFSGTSDFDLGPGSQTLSATGLQDAFLFKMDAFGNFVWAKQFGGLNAYNSVYTVKTDNQDNIYVFGRFTGTTDFNPGVGTYTMNSLAGAMYVCKLNPFGDFIWAKQFGSQSAYSNKELAVVDAANNVYIAGTYSGTCDFDPGIATANLSSTAYAQYLCKLDSNGNFGWVHSISSPTLPSPASITSIAGDNEGSTYLAGLFSGVGSFAFANGTSTLSVTNGQNYICKINNQGHLSWLGQYGGTNPASGSAVSLAIDKSYNIYSTGLFTRMDFDPTVASDTISCYTANTPLCNRIFISKLSQTLLTGLSKNRSENSDVRVFPNPTNNKLNLEMDGLTGKHTIKLYNLVGQLLMTMENSENKITFDVSDYERGVYILEVVSENKLLARQKVIRN